MSQIQKLSIQGVRSFSPESPQVIRFFPITIIIGPNGAGKTSIIESLKYATTGMMPPNSDSGKTFIHDIQFVEESIVRGQIRLQFLDVEQKRTMIVRSFQATQTGKQIKPTFKQLDAVIKREDGVSIDQKLADINSELLKLLGVSKAILNNVIFCHQEDIHWPLGEGKILKEKFDDIFGSIQFTKALEKIKKIRENEVIKYKMLEKDVQFTEMRKKEADKRRKMIQENKSKIDDEKQDIRENQNKINQLDLKIEELMLAEQKAQTLADEMSSLEGSVAEKRKNIAKLEKSCSSELFFKTKKEVNEELQNFDMKFKISKNNKEKFQQKLKELDEKHENLLNEKQKYSHNIARAQELKNQIEKYFKEFDDLILNLSLSPEIKSIYDNMDRNNDSSIKCFNDAIHKFLKNNIEKMNDTFNIEQKHFSNKKTKLNTELELLKNEKNLIDSEIQIRKKDIVNIQHNLKEIENLSSEISSSEDFLNELEAIIKDFQEQLSKFENEQKEIDYQNQMESLEHLKISLKTECDSIKKQISLANANSQKRIKVNHLKEQKLEKISKRDKIKSNNFEIFLKVNAGDDDFSKKLSAMINDQTSKYDEIRSKITDDEKNCHKHITELEILKKSLFQKQNELNSIEQKINSIVEIDKFENFLQTTENDLNRLRRDKSFIENVSQIMDEFMSKIENKKSCPICEHNLDEPWISKCSDNEMNVNLLIEKLKKSKDDNPKKLNEINKEMKHLNELNDKLISLKNEKSSIDQIKEDILKFQNEIKTIQGIIDVMKVELQNNYKNFDSLKSEIDFLKKPMQEAIEYDNLFQNLKEIEQKLNEIGYDVSEDENIEDLNRKLDQKENELKVCDEKLSNIQKEILKANSNQRQLQKNLQIAMKNKLDHEEKVRSQMMKIQRKKELTCELEKNQNTLQTLEEKSLELKPKIEELQDNLTQLIDDFSIIHDESQRNIRCYQDYLQTLEKIMKEIFYYFEESKLCDKQISKEYLEKLDKDIVKSNNEKETLSHNLNLINESITNFELDKIKLSEYQVYLDLKEEVLQVEAKLNAYREQKEMKNIGNIKEKRIVTERSRQYVVTQIEFSKSKILEYEENIRELKTELNQEEYRNAEEKHKETVIKKVIHELSCEDLDKYYRALDFAITTFHRNKLEAINKLIGQFWKVSYQGHDIESIQIMADEEKRSASDRKRSYNYRVVMIKQSKLLDMRGRCSAGQKVLASLIIRMALAVIFSNTFTVLTLDEPTTNLDSLNIKSFARAILTLRNMNRNLQIVIITHDEEFLSYLAEDSVDKYYKVFKDENGFSTISLQNV